MATNILKQLVDERIKKGISQRAMARTLDVSQAYLWQVENSKTLPTIKVTSAYAKAVGFDNDDILKIVSWVGQAEDHRQERAPELINLLAKSENEIFILGTLGVSPIHSCRKTLMEKLKKGCKVRILLQDPNTETADKVFCLKDVDKKKPIGRHYYEALMIYNKIIYIWMHLGKKIDMEFRVCSDLQNFSTVIVDDRYAEFMPHYRENSSTISDKESVDNRFHNQYIISSADGDLFYSLSNESEKLWNSSKRVDLNSLTSKIREYKTQVQKMVSVCIKDSVVDK